MRDGERKQNTLQAARPPLKPSTEVSPWRWHEGEERGAEPASPLLAAALETLTWLCHFCLFLCM